MRKLLTFLIALGTIVFAVVSPASANGVLFLAGPKPAATYTGPGDIVGGALVFYSTNSCYNAAFSGNIMEVWDSATGSTDNTTVSCSVGGVITSTTTSGCTGGGATCQPLATTCATACEIGTLYNQSGTTLCVTIDTACDLISHGARPALTLSAVGGRPCGSDTQVTAIQLATDALSSSVTSPFTMTAVAERTNNFTTSSRFFAMGTSVVRMGFVSTGQIDINAGTALIVSGNTDANPYSIIGTTGALVINGTATTGTTGTTSGSGSIYLFNDGSGSPTYGYVCEAGIWSGAMTSTQYGNLNSNMRSRWGF